MRKMKGIKFVRAAKLKLDDNLKIDFKNMTLQELDSISILYDVGFEISTFHHKSRQGWKILQVPSRNEVC